MELIKELKELIEELKKGECIDNEEKADIIEEIEYCLNYLEETIDDYEDTIESMNQTIAEIHELTRQ